MVAKYLSRQWHCDETTAYKREKKPTHPKMHPNSSGRKESYYMFSFISSPGSGSEPSIVSASDSLPMAKFYLHCSPSNALSVLRGKSLYVGLRFPQHYAMAHRHYWKAENNICHPVDRLSNDCCFVHTGDVRPLPP